MRTSSGFRRLRKIGSGVHTIGYMSPVRTGPLHWLSTWDGATPNAPDSIRKRNASLSNNGASSLHHVFGLASPRKCLIVMYHRPALRGLARAKVEHQLPIGL